MFCAAYVLHITTPLYQNCSSAYTIPSANDGGYVFSVYAVDSVGNIGSKVNFTWIVDTVAPSISSVSNVSLSCKNPYDPAHTGTPSATDNIDPSPSLSYSDRTDTNFHTFRTWTATDQAGNTNTTVQTIQFTSIVAPSVGETSDLYVPCDEAEYLDSTDYVVRVLNVTSLCGRKITVSHDLSPVNKCGITITRQWTFQDDCNGLAYFTHNIHILFPSDPDFPDDGQIDVSIHTSLGWPAYPDTVGYNIYIWLFGTTLPLKPSAFVQKWRLVYTPPNPFPPNTRFLWKIDYIVAIGNGTREIPGPTWGFQTESFADLALVSVKVPPTAFSGASFTVTWTVDNVGNVSTSDSTAGFYGGIYLSRTTNFADSYRAASKYQQRYVDPSDGYVSSVSVPLQPSDIGKFYLFAVVDFYRYVRDFTFDNNRAVIPQTINVQLTPPPNLKIISLNAIGSVYSGKQLSVRFIVQNAGIGITAANYWLDAIYLSKDAFLNSTDQLLSVVSRNGALASGSQYAVNISVTIPNAIYGEYYIIASADVYNYVFENTDEGDNDMALKTTII